MSLMLVFIKGLNALEKVSTLIIKIERIRKGIYSYYKD